MSTDLRFFGFFTTPGFAATHNQFFAGPEQAAAELVRRATDARNTPDALGNRPHVHLYRISGPQPILAASAPEAIPAYRIDLDPDTRQTRISRAAHPSSPAELPERPAITIDDEHIVIGPSQIFPFASLLTRGGDGSPLAEMLSFDPTTGAPLCDHDLNERPFLRVYVNDDLYRETVRSVRVEPSAPIEAGPWYVEEIEHCRDVTDALSSCGLTVDIIGDHGRTAIEIRLADDSFITIRIGGSLPTRREQRTGWTAEHHRYFQDEDAETVWRVESNDAPDADTTDMIRAVVARARSVASASRSAPPSGGIPDTAEQAEPHTGTTSAGDQS